MVAAPQLLVVGAGPAGTAAAISGARAGLDVLLVDRAQLGRDKTCGDGLTAWALRLLESLDVDAPSLDSFTPVDVTVLVSPSGRRVTLPHPTDGFHAAVVRRRELDAALVEASRRAGASVELGVGLEGAVPDGARTKVTLSDGRVLLPEAIVAADGHWSPTRRALEAPHRSGRTRDLGEWHAVRQYYEGVDERRLHVIFDAALLPGYAWVFPLPDGGANVGFGVLRAGRSGADLKRLWRVAVAHPEMRRILDGATPTEQPRAWPIPTRFDAARATIGNVCFAGDSAGLVDPMTGEGIAQALESGSLAARAIAQDPARALAAYEDALERDLGRDLRFAARLRAILARPIGARTALAAIGSSTWTRRAFARWMWEDYPRALLLTPDRWTSRALTPRGAYVAPRPREAPRAAQP